MNSQQKSSNGASLGYEKAYLICPERINHPEMGLERLIELSTMSDGSTVRSIRPKLSRHLLQTRLMAFIPSPYASSHVQIVLYKKGRSSRPIGDSEAALADNRVDLRSLEPAPL
jgi:hypothetical protein